MNRATGRLMVVLVTLAMAGGPAVAQPAPAGAAETDESLYNAAVEAEEAAAMSAAIARYEELRARFPASPLAARGLLRLARIHARIAHHREAAQALEEYAGKYAAEQDAADALNDAAYYRKAIGDDEKAIADLELYIKRYGAKRVDDAAGAYFGMTAIYERSGGAAKVLAHLRSYVKHYGAKGGGDRLVIAYARIGQLLWEQSCPVTPVDGACIAVKRARKGVERCGPDSRPVITVVKRDDRKVKEAMASFAAAMKLYEAAGGRFGGGDEAGARYHYAAARFGQAEVDYEAFLRVAFPSGLDFDPAKPAVMKKSSERFEAWFKEKTRAGTAAQGRYSKLIFDVKEPVHAIAASARMGQLALGFSDALYTAEVPRTIVKNDDAKQAYCTKLTEVAEPYETAAVDAFAAGLRVSTETGWWSAWSRVCERELEILRPDAFPAATERWARPGVDAPHFDLDPPP